MNFLVFLAKIPEHKIDMEDFSSAVNRRAPRVSLNTSKDLRFNSRKTFSRDNPSVAMPLKDKKVISMGRTPRARPQLNVVVVFLLQRMKCVATFGELCLQTEIKSINLCACHKVEKHTLNKKTSNGMCYYGSKNVYHVH